MVFSTFSLDTAKAITVARLSNSPGGLQNAAVVHMFEAFARCVQSLQNSRDPEFSDDALVAARDITVARLGNSPGGLGPDGIIDLFQLIANKARELEQEDLAKRQGPTITVI